MNQLVKYITESIQGKKGKHITIADLTNIEDTICDYFVICQGNSPSHTQSITKNIYDLIHNNLKEKPLSVSGFENAQWIAMDYSDVMVHIFLPEPHDFYDLEHLWEDAQLTTISDID